MKKPTQKQKALDLLHKGFRLSELEGLKYGLGTSLRTRLSELRAEGYPIKDEFVTSQYGSRYKEYFFEDEYLKQYHSEKEVA